MLNNNCKQKALVQLDLERLEKLKQNFISL